MAAAPARAFAADKRWGFAAAAAPWRPPAAGGVEAAPKPTNLRTQRGALPWGEGDSPMPPAPNAWGSSSLLSLEKGEDSGPFVNINDHPSSPGSSSTSTDEIDLLDSPDSCGRTSHDSVTVVSRPQSTELRSENWKFPHSQISFLDVLKAPLRTIAKKRPTSHRKGFTICGEDFPLLDSKSSQSNGQQGHSFQGRPSFSSVVIAARDGKRKIPLTGGDPVSTANFSWEPEQAQLHATQTPDICMPPPCIDYWHPPPDHPPDRNGIRLGGVVSYGPCKPSDKTAGFPVESFIHDGQSVLYQGGELKHGPRGVYHPENNDPCYAHLDTFVESLPHLILETVKDNQIDAPKQTVIKKDVALLEKMKCLPHHILGKVEGNHLDAPEKQPVIKKNLALLEKIKCLNIKARNLHARNMLQISLCKESEVECPKSLNLKSDHGANDVPFSAATSYITSDIDMVNSVSERTNHVLVGASNMSAIPVTTDLSEGHVTEFFEAKKMGNSADNHVCGVAYTSTNLCGSSATDTASNIWGHGWKEHSTVYSLPVTTTSNHEDQPFAGNCSQQVHAKTANDMLKSPYEIQGEEREKGQQKAKLELKRCLFVQNLMSNDAPQENKNLCKHNAGCSGTDVHDASVSDMCCTVYAENLNVPPRPNAVKNTAAAISSTQNVMCRAKKTDISMLEDISQKTEAESHDSSAPKHLQTEDREGQVHKKESIPRGSTPASDTADVNISPFILKTISSVKNIEIKIMEPIDPKGVLHTNESRTPMHLQMEEKRRQVHSHGRITPPSRPAGVNKGSLIHNVIPSAKNDENSMGEHIACKSASESHKNCSPKRLQMENRQRQVRAQERVLRERSNIAESTEDITNVSGTHVNTPNAESKPHVDLSTQSNRPVSPCMFGTVNTETSGLHKAPVSGVVINSSIITMQAPLARGFTVGSIMLGDASSVASLNQEKTVAKEVDDSTTNSCASPKQTNKSGSEIKTEPDNREGEKKKTSKHLVRSSAASDQVSTNGLATLASDLTEEEANSLVLKIMQELSDKLEQVEKQLDSMHVAAVSRSEPTQTVSLPGYTWGEHRVSHSKRQYYVYGQGNVRVSYAANVCGFTQGPSAVSTAHVLPGPISVPVNTLNDISTSGWTWDAAEGILTSDMGNIQVMGTAITSSSGSELTENIHGVSQMELTDSIYGVGQMQVIGGMSYDAVAANPDVHYHHTGLANPQVNPAWFPHGQQDVSFHSSSGTGVYWPQVDVGAAMQSHGVTGSVVGAGHPGYQVMPPEMDVGAAMQSHGVAREVGAGHPGYQLMPVASPGAAYTGSTTVSAGHPTVAWSWGAAYGQHVYYA